MKLSGDNLYKSCDFVFAHCNTKDFSSIPPDSVAVRTHRDGVYDYITSIPLDKLVETSTVFCKTDYLPQLIEYCKQNKFTGKFILVTGQSDFSITDDIYNFVVSHISVVWFAVNAECSKVNPIPLGISGCDFCLKENFRISNTPNKLLYVNHRNENFPQIRIPLYEHFSKFNWATVRIPYDRGEISKYQDELLDHKFVLCPRGNGVDTHRMWEAIYSGVIPIVKTHYTHSFEANIFPILFVDSYTSVTEELLNQKYLEYTSIKWNSDALDMKWWIDRMKLSVTEHK